MTKEQILHEIKRVAAENNEAPPGKQRFTTETGIGESAWGKYWARCGDALQDAGFSRNVWQVPHEEEFLVDCYIRLAREVGHCPVVRELNLERRADPKFPNARSFARLGSKASAAARIIETCRARGGYDDVIKMCQPFLTQKTARTEVGLKPEPEFGFVYLLKSGRYFKIGRSNSAGRREYELAIQLPQKAIKIHEIRTDDPAGIEAYWHNRFAAKRRGGEWFDLDAADVNAFKRRKFM